MQFLLFFSYELEIEARIDPSYRYEMTNFGGSEYGTSMF